MPVERDLAFREHASLVAAEDPQAPEVLDRRQLLRRPPAGERDGEEEPVGPGNGERCAVPLDMGCEDYSERATRRKWWPRMAISMA
jgi:hypothetical protein